LKPLKSTASLESGFTLTEVLVSITITGLITSFLFSALQWGSKALVSAEQTEDKMRVVLVQTLLQRSVENNRSKFEIGTAGQRVSLFSGEMDTLKYISTPPADVMTPGLYRNQVSVTTSTPNALVLKSVLFRPLMKSSDENPLQTAETYTLLENIKGLKISYYGRLDNDDFTGWHDSWSQQSFGPKLIRIKVEFPETDTRYWPPLTIKLFENN